MDLSQTADVATVTDQLKSLQEQIQTMLGAVSMAEQQRKQEVETRSSRDGKLDAAVEALATIMQRQVEAAPPPASNSALETLMQRQEESQRRTEEPWRALPEIRLKTIKVRMERSSDKEKQQRDLLTGLLKTHRYDSDTGMLLMYQLFEPQQLAWWCAVCEAYPDFGERVRCHNYRLYAFALKNPEVCPSAPQMDAAIVHLTMPLLPWAAERLMTEATAYNNELCELCVQRSEVLKEEHRVARMGTVLVGAGPAFARVAAETASPPQSMFKDVRAVQRFELLGGDPHAFVANHPDGTVSIDLAPLGQWLANFETNIAHAFNLNKSEVLKALHETCAKRYQATRRETADQPQRPSGQRSNAPAASRGNGFDGAAAPRGTGYRGRGRGRGNGWVQGGEAAPAPQAENIDPQPQKGDQKEKKQHF